MKTRAERRRDMRNAGYRRAAGKTGRRASIRRVAQLDDNHDAVEALRRRGFVIARPQIVVPGE